MFETFRSPTHPTSHFRFFNNLTRCTTRFIFANLFNARQEVVLFSLFSLQLISWNETADGSFAKEACAGQSMGKVERTWA
jgi:hypothetical protein